MKELYSINYQGNVFRVLKDNGEVIVEYGSLKIKFKNLWYLYKYYKDLNKKYELHRLLWRFMVQPHIMDLIKREEIDLDILKEILGLTIKYDDINKLITFLCMLSAYTDDSQFNVSFRAESSTGKSYIPLEIAQLFPKEDIIEIAYASPSSFFHDHAVKDEETGNFIIDLERKIMIFIDMPHDQLLIRLRPLLSHDRKKLIYKITDKTAKGKLRTKTVELIGYPSVIFCTGKLRVEDQEATRHILLSPETTQEKIREAIYLKALKESNKKAFFEWLESDPLRKLLKERILLIREERITNIVIPEPKIIIKYFIENNKLKPRYTRDVERLIYLAKALALLNLWHRERRDGDLIADEKDILNALELYEGIAEAQELGVPPYVYDIFKNIILPLYKENGIGVSKRELAQKFYELHGRILEDWRIRLEIIPSLETAGLITLEPDPNDKRRKLIVPILEGGVYHHSITIESDQNESIIQKIIELYNKGLSLREISRRLNISYSKVWRTIKNQGDSKVIDSIVNDLGDSTPSNLILPGKKPRTI